MNETIKTLRDRYENHLPGLLDARMSFAVLCPLVEKEDGLHLLYEVRASSIRQGGEVCFPGGKMEPGETPLETALRETEEELRIPRSEIQILGTPDFIFSQGRGGFLLRPILALVTPEGMAAMKPSPDEVSETFTVPLSFFQEHAPLDAAYHLAPEMPEDFPFEAMGIAPGYPFARGTIPMPVWDCGHHVIWGMTARLTRQIIRALEA